MSYILGLYLAFGGLYLAFGALPILAILFRPLGFIAPQTLNNLAFNLSMLSVQMYLMKVIPETRRAHYI